MSSLTAQMHWRSTGAAAWPDASLPASTPCSPKHMHTTPRMLILICLATPAEH
jgi:hypothetical protein